MSIARGCPCEEMGPHVCLTKGSRLSSQCPTYPLIETELKVMGIWSSDSLHVVYFHEIKLETEIESVGRFIHISHCHDILNVYFTTLPTAYLKVDVNRWTRRGTVLTGRVKPYDCQQTSDERSENVTESVEKAPWQWEPGLQISNNWWTGGAAITNTWITCSVRLWASIANTRAFTCIVSVYWK